MVLTPTSPTSEMPLSWPLRYISLHGLNKIINSTNILGLSSLVLVSPHHELNKIFHFPEVGTAIPHTVTDSADSRFNIHFIWRLNDAHKTWYLNLYEMNGWETSSILTPARRPSRDPFLPILFRGTSDRSHVSPRGPT